MVEKNVEEVKKGEVKYVMGEGGGVEGYWGMKGVWNEVVLKKGVRGVKYMGMEMVMKEKMELYFEFE